MHKALFPKVSPNAPCRERTEKKRRTRLFKGLLSLYSSATRVRFVHEYFNEARGEHVNFPIEKGRDRPHGCQTISLSFSRHDLNRRKSGGQSNRYSIQHVTPALKTGWKSLSPGKRFATSGGRKKEGPKRRRGFYPQSGNHLSPLTGQQPPSLRKRGKILKEEEEGTLLQLPPPIDDVIVNTILGETPPENRWCFRHGKGGVKKHKRPADARFAVRTIVLPFCYA